MRPTIAADIEAALAQARADIKACAPTMRPQYAALIERLRTTRPEYQTVDEARAALSALVTMLSGIDSPATAHLCEDARQRLASL